MSQFLNATAKVIIFTSKTLSDGKSPIMLKVTFKGKRKHYSTGFNMLKNEFEKLQSSKRLTKNQSEIQTQLQSIEVKARKTIDRLIDDKKAFSHGMFESEFFTKQSDTNVFKLFQQRINLHESRGAYKTRDICRSAKKSFRKFWGKEDLLLEDITPDFLQKYEMKNRKLSPNTMGVYERNLRTIYNWGIELGMISPESNPFKRHKIPNQPGIKKALLKEDILKILNHNCEKYSHKWLAQQVYIFSYLCNGINLKDLAQLKWADISDGRLLFIRSKTSTTSATPKINSIKVTQALQLILNDLKKYYQGQNDFIFPILTKGGSDEDHYKRIRDYTGVLNRNIRMIANELGIEKDFTFYSARHSWATVLKRSGTSVSVISELMHHSSEAVTRIYLDSFGNDELDRANENLL